jgi:hypothetical protein
MAQCKQRAAGDGEGRREGGRGEAVSAGVCLYSAGQRVDGLLTKADQRKWAALVRQNLLSSTSTGVGTLVATQTQMPRCAPPQFAAAKTDPETFLRRRSVAVPTAR